jgi:hypothetical protein
MIVRKLVVLTILILGIVSFTSCYSYGPTNRLFTPVPTLIYADAPNPIELASSGEAAGISCKVRAVDLMGAWVSEGFPELEIFEFIDISGQRCLGTFYDDVQSLFLEANLWFEGAPACVSCHNSDLTASMQNMDLSSYAGILAGSHRENDEATGNDILGAGIWEDAMLYAKLINREMPLGRPPESPAKGPEIFAGSLIAK